jgi:drug efflux transport system permease protein
VVDRLRSLLIKEFLQVLRDPRMRMILVVMPIVQLIIFGYAASTDVRHVATAVHDLDHTRSSRELVSRFEKSGYFDVVARVVEEGEARELLDRGAVRAVLRVDAGFEADLEAGRTAPAQMVLDGTDSNTAGIVLGYGAKIIGQYSRDLLGSRIDRAGRPLRPGPRVVLEDRAWFNENLESRHFYVPGVIAIIVTTMTLILTAMSVVREREIGTMEQIMVTPIRPVEFILGKSLPFVLIGFLDVVLVSAVGVGWFEVPIRGSLLLLLGCTGLYLMTTIGFGLLISTISTTQQQALMSTFFFYFPALLLSGFMFPIANMPEAVQWMTYVNPMRYFVVILRGIFLKGVGVAVLWPQMAAVAALGVAALWLAVGRFRKTLA